MNSPRTTPEAPYFRGSKCPNCGELNRPGTNLCEKCGTRLAGSTAPSVFLVLLFVFFGIPGLVFGGCSAMFGIMVLGEGTHGDARSFATGLAVWFGLAAFGFGLFWFLLYAAFLRKRK